MIRLKKYRLSGSRKRKLVFNSHKEFALYIRANFKWSHKAFYLKSLVSKSEMDRYFKEEAKNRESISYKLKIYFLKHRNTIIVLKYEETAFSTFLNNNKIFEYKI